jgi:hypothetical protein
MAKQGADRFAVNCNWGTQVLAIAAVPKRDVIGRYCRSTAPSAADIAVQGSRLAGFGWSF